MCVNIHAYIFKAHILSYRSVDRAFECIEEKTSVSCGETAKEFIHHYVGATLQPLMKDVTCNHSEYCQQITVWGS